MRSRSVLRVVVLCLGVASGWCQAQDPPLTFAGWTGQSVPDGLPLIGPALAAERAIVLHFTGDAGPDNIAQTIALNQLRGQYGTGVVFLRAEDETAAGDRLFEAFRATRIPSVMVLDATGRIVAVFEGPADAGALAEAIDEARAASPSPTGGALTVYDLSNPLPSPSDRLGHLAPASTPAIRAALEQRRPTVFAFLGAYSRFHAEQEEVLGQLQAALEGLSIIAIAAEEPTNEPAYSDYLVTGVPTLFVVSADGIIRAHFGGLTGLSSLVAAAADALARPAPGPEVPEIAQPANPPPIVEPDPPENALAPQVPVEPGAELEVAQPPGRVLTDPPLPRGPYVFEPDDAPRDPLVATAGDPANPLSPEAGSVTSVDSAVNEEYGPNQLVDGLRPGDEGFRPWVSSAGHGLPLEIRVQPADPGIVALILHPATGDRSLFGPRWPRTIEVLLAAAGGEDLAYLGTYELPPDGSDFTIDLPGRVRGAIVLRILATHGGAGACEMAEISAR